MSSAMSVPISRRPISPLRAAQRQAELFHTHSAKAARELIGWTLSLDGVGGRIVETEAYHHEDPASHTFAGPTARNAVMWGPPGRIYVYRSYGLHWCMNLVCGETPGSAVLIRALEPTHGLDVMIARRRTEDVRRLMNGPGNVCQALGVTRAHDGMAVDHAPFALEPGPAGQIAVGPRIGISKAVDVPWRFGEAGSKFLSKPFPSA
jgi:DNA-3-methyladenine glycosylase